ncbi:MAG: DUF1476 domain-containing protein [Rhodospirillales bacterium]
MTDTLREIERGHEAKYKLDEEMRFRAQCRRDKLLGLWAAGLMGMTGPEAEAYAKRLVRLDLDEPGSGNVVRRVGTDFAAAGVRLSEKDILDALKRYHATALDQLSGDFPKALDRDHMQVGG